jgi:hypothetical protein
MLQEVPEEVSAEKDVEKYWPTVVAAIFDGFPLEIHLEFIENRLVERGQLISQGMLDSSFDWAADLTIAR